MRHAQILLVNCVLLSGTSIQESLRQWFKKKIGDNYPQGVIWAYLWGNRTICNCLFVSQGFNLTLLLLRCLLKQQILGFFGVGGWTVWNWKKIWLGQTVSCQIITNSLKSTAVRDWLILSGISKTKFYLKGENMKFLFNCRFSNGNIFCWREK